MRDCHKWASRVSNSDTSTQYRLDCLLAKLDWQISGAGSVITRLKTYADNSPVHLNLNQMAAKAAALPGISHVGVSYSDTAIQYRHDILYCQIGLPNLQCVIYRNETHGIWPGFSGAPESCWIVHGSLFWRRYVYVATGFRCTSKSLLTNESKPFAASFSKFNPGHLS
jgi:hypothetical protein